MSGEAGKAGKRAAREDRLAEALRANLRRRKSQARERGRDSGSRTVADRDDDAESDRE